MLATARSISFLFFLALALGLATAAQAGPDLPVCGDGAVDEEEQCDDGNNTGGDGCSPTCQFEVCGNGTVDPGEQCDDGDTANDDGCNDQCQLEICGDGDLNPGEACDDGNNTPGDGCRADCTLEACGDGIQDAGEQCDDGNVADGDGCSASCTIEGEGPFCGDGNVDEGEACDDGNNTSGDGCRANCTIEMCGDEILDAGEECDDGNLVDGDGCSANCTLEAVDPFCGDGSVDEGEECDDGNNTAGDGCSATCTIEEDLAICGDGDLDEGEQCDDGNTGDGDGCSATCTLEEGDGQNDGQQACINGLNKAGEVVNETVNKVGLKCLKAGISDGCSDGEKKIAKAFERTVKTEEKKCEEGNLPDFAYTGAGQVNESASGASATLFRVFVDFAPLARFGDDIGEPEADRCKVRVAEAGTEALEKLFKLGNKAKKASLAEGASSGLQLQTEVVAFIDQGGKFESNAEYQVLKTLSSKCKGEDLREVAPGCVVESIGFARGIDPKPELSATALAECVVDSARCGWCLGFNGMDDLDIDCDAFDDGVSNGSCGEVVALED